MSTVSPKTSSDGDVDLAVLEIGHIWLFTNLIASGSSQNGCDGDADSLFQKLATFDLDMAACSPLKPVVTEEKLNLLWPQPQSIVQGGGKAFVIKDNLEVLILASPGQGMYLWLIL